MPTWANRPAQRRLANCGRLANCAAILLVSLGVILTGTTEAQGGSKSTSFNNGNFKPRAGDRIAFFGDSITDDNIYPQIIEHHYRVKYPAMGLTFGEFGADSESSVDALARIDTDLVPFNPSVVVVFLGINDALYRAPWELPETQQRFAAFQTNYPNLLNQLNQKLPAARLVLFTTTVVDNITIPTALGYDQSGINEVLRRYSAFIQKVGRQRGVPVVDVFSPMLKAMQAGRSQSPPLLVMGDGIHPGVGGYYILAAAILKQWGEPKLAVLK